MRTTEPATNTSTNVSRRQNLALATSGALSTLLGLFGLGCGGQGGVNPIAGDKKDVAEGVECAAMQTRCASTAKTLEESKECRAKARAYCADGGSR